MWLSCSSHHLPPEQRVPGDPAYPLCFYTSPCYVEAIGMSTRTDLPQGTLDMLILQIVALAPIHGYGIAQRLQRVSRDALHVPQGSLYPALHRLENRGLLKADWKASDTGRDAKFYRLTPEGRARLKDQAANWSRLSEAIRLILGEARGGAA